MMDKEERLAEEAELRAEKAEAERDALADSMAELYMRHAIDSGCSPNSITARAINEIVGEVGSDRQALILKALERHQSKGLLESRLKEFMTLVTDLFYADTTAEEQVVWVKLNEAIKLATRLFDE